MNRFAYRAYDQAGARHEGEVTALTLASARLKLKEQGLIPVKVAPQVPPAATIGFFRRLYQQGRPGLAELEFFTAQMSLLLKNGIKIDRALEAARKAVTHAVLSHSLTQILEEVRAGTPLDHALARHSAIFDALYVSVVQIGQATGNLPEAFNELARNLAFRREIRGQTSQALAYPLVILVVCLLAVVFIFNFIIPRFESLFARMDHIPVYTGLLLAVSDLFVRFQWVIYLALPALPLLLLHFGKHAVVKTLLHTLVLKLPITRGIATTLENLRFTSAMALLLRSGVLLVDALDFAVRAVGNTVIRRRLLTVRDEVKQGRKLSQAIGKTGFLPEVYAGILEVGEQTGNLEEVFRDMEQRTRSDYERRLRSLLTLIEPLMILIMGAMVGSIVIIMLLSTVSLQQIKL